MGVKTWVVKFRWGGGGDKEEGRWGEGLKCEDAGQQNHSVERYSSLLWERMLLSGLQEDRKFENNLRD
jgi:hypothetical protein